MALSSAKVKNPPTYTLVLLGDLMLGRLVDALLPTSIAREAPDSDPESAAKLVDRHFLPKYAELKSYSYLSPWGNSVNLIRSADVVIANLETALTMSEQKWQDKVFNYRSHPENVKCLTEVGMGGGRKRGYVSLANNHTLDWEVEGLIETVKTLSDAGVEFAGAGRTQEEAKRPAALQLGGTEIGTEYWNVKCWSFSDHPSEWKVVDTFNFIDYTTQGREILRRQILAEHSNERGEGDSKQKSDLKVVSMHWGPNYQWQPARETVELAHWLIDECDVDIIHGHSSHHVQGAEIYNGKLIVYGCGDFVDDYAVDKSWRNDLSAAWRVTVGVKDEAGEQRVRLVVQKLEVFPNRIHRFSANLLSPDDEDHQWMKERFRQLCGAFGTKVEEELGSEGQIIINVRDQD
jgi:poly-gamma-glutamate capsule biosynthesis protein CapA/YwtB (metallophosphatase superfamily)